MKELKKVLAILLCLCMCLSLLVGCANKSDAPAVESEAPAKESNSSEEPASSTEPADSEDKQEESIAGQEIVMWTFLDPVAGTSGRETALAKMIESFESETGAKVVVEPVEHSTLPAKFLAAHNAGNAPDIIWVTVSELGNCINQGALEPLDNLFMADWTEEEWADADTPAFRGGVSNEGLHYQLPFSVNCIAMIYRSDLLEAAGYDVGDGSAFEDWDEFKDAVANLTVEKDELTGAKRYGYGSVFPASGGDTILVSNMLLDKTGKLWNEDGTAAWANEAGVSGVNLITDLYSGGYMSDTALTDTIENLYEDFKAGKYAMINGPSTRLQNLIAGASFDPTTIRMMPYPSDSEEYSASVLGGWCAGVWSGSENKVAAGLFLEHMFYNDYLWVTEGGQPPVLRSTEAKLEEAGFFDDPANLYVRDISNCIANATVAQPTDYSISGWKNDVNNAMQEIMVNGVDVMDALSAAEASFNERNCDD